MGRAHTLGPERNDKLYPCLSEFTDPLTALTHLGAASSALVRCSSAAAPRRARGLRSATLVALVAPGEAVVAAHAGPVALPGRGPSCPSATSGASSAGPNLLRRGHVHLHLGPSAPRGRPERKPATPKTPAPSSSQGRHRTAPKAAAYTATAVSAALRSLLRGLALVALCPPGKVCVAAHPAQPIPAKRSPGAAAAAIAASPAPETSAAASSTTTCERHGSGSNQLVRGCS